MANTNTLVDLGDGTAVSSNSPQSPTGSALLDTPITLDFDPMSFQFKEDSPLTSPSDNSRELGDTLSPSQNTDVVDFFDPFCPVKEESPTDYYPHGILGQPVLGETGMENSNELLMREEGFTKHEINEDTLISEHADEMCEESKTIITTTTFTTVQEITESSHSSDMLIAESPDNAYPTSPIVAEIECETLIEIEPPSESDDLTPNGEEACLIEPIESPVDERLNEDKTEHDVEQDEVFQHVECPLADADPNRRGKISSISSIYSSKSDRSEKRSTTRKKSSTSSESSLKDEEPKSPKSPTSLKLLKKEETVSQKREAIQEKKVISTSKSEKISYQAVNGVDKSISIKNGMDDNDMEDIEHQERSESPECPISVAELRSTYVHQTAQENLSLSPSKEIIETGIDIKSLKCSYTQHAQEERDISPNRETISTGIDIKSLKSSFIVPREDCKSKETEVIETGVSVRTLKSSFTKTDEEVHQSVLQEEVKPSVDRAKVQRTFSQESYPIQDGDDFSAHDEKACLCKICAKHVYQMEKMKAEKNVFHKNCFRCRECNKLLNVDTYSSHEGEIFCKPHFRQLFQPKARFDGEDGAPTATLHTDELDDDEGKQRRNELIIRENIPAELPPDVVRSDSKPDHGLESLPVNLNNLKSKFEGFKEEHHLPSTTDVCTLQRSASVMARLAKYQSAVSGDSQENGVESNSESEEDGEEDGSVIKSTKHKEKVVFSGMSNLKSQWETGSVTATKEERMEEKKEELNKLRQRMCLGRSESMKAVYEKACQDSNKTTPTRSESVVLGRDVRATRIKEKFEKGELVSEVEEEKMEKARREKEEDMSVFTEPGMANDAKKLFKQMDATVKTTAISPTSPNKSPMNERKKNREVLYTSQSSVTDADVVKCSEPTAKEDIPVDTTDVTERFKFFENYSELPKERKRFQITPPREPAKEDTPDRDIEHDPTIVRSVDNVDDIPVTDTARRMLDKFKALEKEAPSAPAGPKPLKRITPPREYTKEDEHHDSSPEPERDPNIVRASYKADEDIIVEADKAKSLRAKFENWEIEMRENRKNEEEEEEEEDFLPQVDTTKTLRAKFEAIKEDTLKPLEKSKPKVNRFIQEQAGTNMELCSICGKKVYPMEKMETSGMRLHKNCFRCAHCSCMLRLENYTTSGGRLYCTPHFKQLFISRGNYDEGFGREQHKEKWNRSCNNTPTPRDLHENGDVVHHDEYTNGDAQCLEQMA